MTDPKPGLIGLTTISGRVGKLIEVGEYLNGEGFQRWEHAFVTLPGGLILEAEPGGARIVPMRYDDVYWCNGLRKVLDSAPVPQVSLPALAETLVGVPYSGLDYAALALHRFHLHPPGLKAYIASTGHMICSQMADELYFRMGAHLFTDDRWPGYVTPASLYERDRELA